MLSEPDGPFINPSQLNLAKYADRPGLNKVLFDYLFYHENDIKNSLELAALATQVRYVTIHYYILIYTIYFTSATYTKHVHTLNHYLILHYYSYRLYM